MTIIYSELEELVTQAIVKRFNVLDALESQNEVVAMLQTLTNIVTLFSIRMSLILTAQSLRMGLTKTLTEMINEYAESIGQGGRDTVGFNEGHNMHNELYDIACTILPYHSSEEWLECYRRVDINEALEVADETDIDVIDVISVLIAMAIKSRILILTLSEHRKENAHGRNRKK